MTAEQFGQLMKLIDKIASNQFTITGAADWPILVVIGGILLTMLMTMWIDLKGSIKEHRGEWRESLKEHQAEDEKEIQLLWDAMKDCKRECCPPRTRG